jgi:DNA-binding PucR family transcriptional regulator
VELGLPLDTEQHLAQLVLTADPDALADLRTRALAPLAGLRPATAEKLAATLRSWLLHHGRREEIASELFVHPQTVRYRMGQLREHYGDRLDDPATVLELTLALGADVPRETR